MRVPTYHILTLRLAEVEYTVAQIIYSCNMLKYKIEVVVLYLSLFMSFSTSTTQQLSTTFIEQFWLLVTLQMKIFARKTHGALL